MTSDNGYTLRRIIVLFLGLVVSLAIAALAAAQTSTPLRYGDTAAGSIRTAAPVIYTFEGQRNDVIRVTAAATTRGFQLRVALLGANLSQLTLSRAGERAEFSYRLPQSGSYFLVVTSAGGTTGAYALTLDADVPPPILPTHTPPPPIFPRADSPVTPVVDVYSDRVTTFSSALSNPDGTRAQQVTLRFLDLISSQPQTFRYTLTCDDQYADLFPWVEGSYGDYLAWFDGRRCGSSVTEMIEPASLIPVSGFEVWLISESLPFYFSYTLTIEPLMPLLPVAAADSDHMVNVSAASQTSFTQAVSAPLGDRADKITVRSTDLGSGGGKDFDFYLLCTGTGTEAVEWVTAVQAVILGCGDTFTYRLEGSGVVPIPSLDMVVSLDNRAEPAHVQYTLVITPAGVTGTSPAAADFVVALTGTSQRSGTLAAGSLSAAVNVSVAGMTVGYPRTITFSLACSGANLAAVRAVLQGIPGDYGCGESFQRVFAAPGEQASLTVTRTQASSGLTYLLTAAPLYDPVAPPDTDPRLLALQPAQAVSFGNVISSPEGDNSDTVLLDVRQFRPTALPRQYTIRLVCEGAVSSFVRGLTDTGLLFGCGGAFEHTFAAGQPARTPLSQTSKAEAGLLSAQPPSAAATDPLTLPVHIYLPPDAPAGLVSYVLLVEPIGFSPVAPAEETIVQEHIAASSSQVTTFTRSLTSDQVIHRLSVSFPDLQQAHWQEVDFRLTCSGIGTGAVRWYDSMGVPRTCGGVFRQRFETYPDTPVPGVTLDVRLENPSSGTLAVEYTLHIEPASPYVPIVPEDTTIYQLAIALNQPTTFTRQLSSPGGSQLNRIYATVFDMIGGQAAGRNFTFWLECAGPNAEITTLSVTFDGLPVGYSPFTTPCFVPVTRFIDEGAGSPPRVWIEVSMPQAAIPAYNQYTLHIIPAGAQLPFDPLAPTATATPPLLQVITLAPGITPTPTATMTPVPPPQLISPANGAIFDTQPVMLVWSALAGDPRYEVEIQQCNLQGSVCNTTTVMVNSASYSLPLTQTTRVFWRVRALLTDGSLTGYSEQREFVVFLATLTPSMTPTPLLLQAITVAPSVTPTGIPRQRAITITPTSTPTSLIQEVPFNPGLFVSATPTVHPSGLSAPQWEWPILQHTVLNAPSQVHLRWQNIPDPQTGITSYAYSYEVGMAVCTGTPPDAVDCDSYQYTTASNAAWDEGLRVYLNAGLYRFIVRAVAASTGPGPNSEPRLIEVLAPTAIPSPTGLPFQYDITLQPIPGAPVVPLGTVEPMGTISGTPTTPSMPTSSRETDIPVAAPDRDYVLIIRLGEGVRFSEAISYPEGDTGDTVSVTVEGLGREQVNYRLSLACTGIGTEAVRGTVGRVAFGCGSAITIPFTTTISTQSVTLSFDPRAPRSYVTYTILIAPG
jgi:hypothetical protein